MPKYRLYIDESGSVGYSSAPKISQTIQQRYLGLTGLIIESEENDKVLNPRIRAIRKLFTDDPDDLPVLHREDICNGIGAFSKLADSEFESLYNQQLEEMINTLSFQIITVVIDKTSHKEKYGNSCMDPYHYSLHLLLERYVKFLERNSSTGDVMVEDRGKREDRLLDQSYERFYNFGTYYLPALRVQTVLTSKKVKSEQKTKGVAGLQLADLISLPSKLDVLKSHKKISKDLTQNFTKKIIDMVQGKYLTNGMGWVQSVGKKMI